MKEFFANLYELFGLTYLDSFSDDMYQNGYYIPIGIAMFISIFVVGILYYYVINHPRWNRWFWWLLTGIVLSITNVVYAWVRAESMLTNLYNNAGITNPYGTPEYFPFSVVAGVLTLFFFFVFSFIVKWGSRNCKHSPFL